MRQKFLFLSTGSNNMSKLIDLTTPRVQGTVILCQLIIKICMFYSQNLYHKTADIGIMLHFVNCVRYMKS